MQKVIIVDDSVVVIRQLEKIISGSGHFEVVGRGNNGLEAIKLHQELRPDIICMDMNMPGMDGITALRALVARDAAVKVVMITSLGGVGDKFSEAMKIGAKAVLSKPFESATVITTLQSL
ncbi:response regulator [Geomonas sp. RF6]|uniref:response regulator n=1 Tax=Geomonas sp. RF6 TaxID=2897342 RepID=UPI001E4401F7|nr:response regulator [Geomonas sp. RF6]UFS70774.1 response regulator [Geomonas sp. RF6]